ncbi:MAG: bifunctional phosphoribosylaminoimidazolecarboxamide formyltransferase/IMP cyclohydrolase [Tepidisphaera sp.]|nr:bifunctional phosphoribosylaminoimidazolecarboxamide formyltransferase/IMP cyclohydrolase [Tepidisphaera sp.]
MAELATIRSALLSVSDKAGLIPFARALASHGVELISTGGTAAAITQAGLPVTPIDKVTGFPEMLDGRVKTLHPMVHGGLLGVRDNPAHVAAMQKHGIRPIDLVCVNLYPFEQTIATPGCTFEHAIENIDIGGPSMLRSAAKNFEHVTVVTSPEQYERVIAELASQGGKTSRRLRAELARAAFALTCRYDGAIAAYLEPKPASRFPAILNVSYVRAEELRQGENPHQGGAIYRSMNRPQAGTSIAHAEQLHGKELSYNNLNDAQAALSLALAIRRAVPGQVGAAVIKHTNPCGAASAPDAREAVAGALAGDPLAAYGGILALSSEMDSDAATLITSDKSIFLEVIVAPGFSAAALELLRARWANVRLLASGQVQDTLEEPPLELRTLPGGLLAQTPDTLLAGDFAHKAGPAPTREQLKIAAFLEPVCRALFSNAVCLGGVAKDGSLRLFGAGAGQMDRVTASRLAVEKAGPLAEGSVCFSDAFFPFSDGPTLLGEAGVSVIVHPGGSKRDQDTFDLCTARGICCLTTGIRHFRH